MRRRYNIRWSDSDDQLLRKTVKNFNAKITRLNKKLPPEKRNALPGKASVKELKEVISTRQDFKREIASLQRFSKRGAEEIVKAPDNYYNVEITEWQRDDMIRRARAINRMRTTRLEKMVNLSATSRGVDVGYKRGEGAGIAKNQEVELMPVKAFTPKQDRYDIREKHSALIRESSDTYWLKREIRVRKNFIKGIRQNFSSVDTTDLINHLERMDIGMFIERFMSEIGVWEHAYPMSVEEEEGEYSALCAIFKFN